jgi:hypothetical protein
MVNLQITLKDKFISDSIIKNSPRSVQLCIIKNCQNV